MSAFITEIQGDHFPEIFDAFEHAVGAGAWMKRAKSIDTEVRSKPFLKDYLFTENRIAYALCVLTQEKRSHGALRGVRVNSLADYEAYALVTQFMSLYAALPKVAAEKLARRLQGAFKNPDDLRGLQFEWLIATHLVKRSFAVEFPTEVEGTHDFIATRDGVAADVECKSVSSDKGRQIHRRDALEIYSLLLPSCRPFIRTLSKGLLVRVTVPRRLPTKFSERQQLSDRIRHGIVSGAGFSEPDLEVRLYDFDVAESHLLPHPPRMERVRSFFEKRFGIVNRELVVLYSEKGRALVICLESRTPDRMIEGTIQTVKDACDRQLSGERAGVVCVKFEDLTAGELEELGDETGAPTGLRIAASRFLDSRRGSSLVCLAFFSDGPLERVSDAAVTRNGRTYFFENKDSPQYSDVVATAFRNLS